MDPASDKCDCQWARMAECTDVVCLGWWAAGGPLLSRAGVAELFAALIQVLPETLLSRWDNGPWPNPRMQTGPTAGDRDLKRAERQARWTVLLLVMYTLAVLILLLVVTVTAF